EQWLFVKATDDYWTQNSKPNSKTTVWGVARGEWMKGDPKLGIGKALLRFYGSTNPIVSLTIADSNGSALTEAQLTLQQQPSKAVPLAPDSRDTDLVPSDSDSEILRLINQSGSSVSSMEMVTVGPKGEKRLTIPASPALANKPASAGLIDLLTNPE